MSAKKEKTVIGLILGFIGRVFCVCCIALCAWTMYVLLSGLYFPRRIETIIQEKEAHKSALAEKMGAIEESKDLRQHFHNIDDTIFVEEKDPPLCLTCHGNLPHSKAQEMRSLLNMHTYFIACEVCHVRTKENQDVYYAWFDFDTKEKIYALNGNPGNYKAKIVPVLREANGTERRLDAPLNETFAKEFIQEGYKWTLEQKAKAKAIIHENHTKSPVLCDECHRKNGHLPFEDLHYSEKRAGQLSGTEAAGMVARYIEFYLPTMFDPNLSEKRALNQKKTVGAAEKDGFDVFQTLAPKEAATGNTGNTAGTGNK